MREKFNIGTPATAYVAEASRLTLEALSQVKTQPRWLLVFDNAEDIDEVRPYIPAGGGHVLITSRSRDWTDRAQARPVPVEVFTRPESVQHLRQRAPSISADDADKVAEVLGDLPVAVAAAGAYFPPTTVTAVEFLPRPDSPPPPPPSATPNAAHPTPASPLSD